MLPTLTPQPTNWRRKADAWVVDYTAARERAIRWLGDQYLLATPVRRTHVIRRNPQFPR
jgi:hypothetical protein